MVIRTRFSRKINMKNNTKIAIIGYGELGRAVHKLLKIKKELIVEVWDKKGGPDQKSLSETVSLSSAVFICVPSWCVREALSDIKYFLSKDAFVICLSKGIEEKTLKTMDVVLTDILPPNQPVCILSGPMLAEELTAGKRGFGVVAVKNKKDFKLLKGIFNGTNLAVEYSSDLRGVALCGVLKNIYALGLGAANGLELGSDVAGRLCTMALNEMIKIVDLLGGKGKTALGTAGIGDLIATGFSRYSRNRAAGVELVETGICCLKSEGFTSVGPMAELLGKKADELPFFNILKSIVLENGKPGDVFKNI